MMKERKGKCIVVIFISVICLFSIFLFLLDVCQVKKEISYSEEVEVGLTSLINDYGLLGIDFGNDEVHKGRVLSKTDPLDWYGLFKLKVNDEINEVTDGHKSESNVLNQEE